MRDRLGAIISCYVNIGLSSSRSYIPSIWPGAALTPNRKVTGHQLTLPDLRISAAQSRRIYESRWSWNLSLSQAQTDHESWRSKLFSSMESPAASENFRKSLSENAPITPYYLIPTSSPPNFSWTAWQLVCCDAISNSNCIVLLLCAWTVNGLRLLSFVYLGSCVSGKGDMGEKISVPVSKIELAFPILFPPWLWLRWFVWWTQVIDHPKHEQRLEKWNEFSWLTLHCYAVPKWHNKLSRILRRLYSVLPSVSTTPTNQ